MSNFQENVVLLRQEIFYRDRLFQTLYIQQKVMKQSK